MTFAESEHPADPTAVHAADAPGVQAADPAAEPAADASPKKKRRGLRILWWVLGIIGGLLVVAIVGILIWSQVGVAAAEPEPLAAVEADDRIVITDDSAAFILEPASGATDVGLVFIPGAAILILALAFNLVGDGLRDALDPTQRGRA